MHLSKFGKILKKRNQDTLETLYIVLVLAILIFFSGVAVHTIESWYSPFFIATGGVISGDGDASVVIDGIVDRLS